MGIVKRGFKNALFKKEYEIVTLQRLNDLFEDGAQVTKMMLVGVGCVSSNAMVKLLATGTITKKIDVQVDACSKTAKEAVERAGGSVNLV